MKILIMFLICSFMWIVPGIIACFIVVIDDLKDKKYDPEYFKEMEKDDRTVYFVLLVLGPLSLIFVILVFTYLKIKSIPQKSKHRKILYNTLYFIANKGKKYDKDVDTETNPERKLKL